MKYYNLGANGDQYDQHMSLPNSYIDPDDPTTEIEYVLTFQSWESINVDGAVYHRSDSHGTYLFNIKEDSEVYCPCENGGECMFGQFVDPAFTAVDYDDFKYDPDIRL